MVVVDKLKKYLAEIEKNDKSEKKINAILQLNPRAMDEAKAIDSKKNKGKLTLNYRMENCYEIDGRE